jgi:predicted metal-dependent HD superfamily phosphohydrolase
MVAEQQGGRASDTAELARAWQALLEAHTDSPQATETGRALLASWTQPHRRYHTIGHLRDVLVHVDVLAPHAADLDAVRLAAWYHDSVYDCRPDDEENSARRAATDLAALHLPPASVAEVAPGAVDRHA